VPLLYARANDDRRLGDIPGEDARALWDRCPEVALARAISIEGNELVNEQQAMREMRRVAANDQGWTMGWIAARAAILCPLFERLV
jgi:hypothetical protein